MDARDRDQCLLERRLEAQPLDGGELERLRAASVGRDLRPEITDGASHDRSLTLNRADDLAAVAPERALLVVGVHERAHLTKLSRGGALHDQLELCEGAAARVGVEGLLEHPL